MAALSPRFLAAETPLFFCRSTRILPSVSASLPQTTALSSAEPSSTAMISRLPYVWPVTDQRHCSIYLSALYTGIITDIFFIEAAFPSLPVPASAPSRLMNGIGTVFAPAFILRIQAGCRLLFTGAAPQDVFVRTLLISYAPCCCER